MPWYCVTLHVDGAAPAAHVVRADDAVEEGPPGHTEGGRLRLLREGRTVFRAPMPYVLGWSRFDTQRQAEDDARAFRERLRDGVRRWVEEAAPAPRLRARRRGEAPLAPGPAGHVLEGVRVRIES